MILIIIILSVFLVYCDIKYMTLPNVVIAPAIFLCIATTGNLIPAILMLFLGVYMYAKGYFCGGDAKLLALAGAAMGENAILAVGLATAAVYTFRILKGFRGAILSSS
jgi:Flp pilus assembly protein protease CpaA